VVHNKDQLEILQNSLIERTPKVAFQALNLSIKHSRPFPSDLKTDQEVLKQGKLSKVIFEILRIPTILHLLLLLVSRIYSSQKVDAQTVCSWL